MLTLAQSKVGMKDHVDQQIVDEFRRQSYLLDKLVFDNAVAAGGVGSTLVYGYQKLMTPSVGEFREINGQYKGGEAIREEKSARLKILGGSFKLDRVIIETSGAVDELAFQVQEKIKGAVNLFHYAAINGDTTAVDSEEKNKGEFDGLNKMLTGSSTEFNKTTAIDLSTSANMDTNYNAFLDMMDEFVGLLAEKPTMLLMNSKMLTKMKGIARRAGYYSRMEDAFGRSVDMWDGIPMVDLGDYWNGSASSPVVPIEDSTGTTDIYAVCIAQDGFHGVSLTGDKLIKSYLPDLTAPNPIKEGDVELVTAVVLKNTLKAGVFRKIKVK